MLRDELLIRCIAPKNGRGNELIELCATSETRRLGTYDVIGIAQYLCEIKNWTMYFTLCHNFKLFLDDLHLKTFQTE